jgi:hypothetical protein
VVYNLLGQKIRELVNKFYPGGGTYKIGLNAGNLSSGIYIYQIMYEDVKGTQQQRQTRKMILIK